MGGYGVVMQLFNLEVEVFLCVVHCGLEVWRVA
jgi:hypothetical protein